MNFQKRNPVPWDNGNRIPEHVSFVYENKMSITEQVKNINNGGISFPTENIIDPVRFPILFTHWCDVREVLL
jgi:hypothetical protein